MKRHAYKEHYRMVRTAFVDLSVAVILVAVFLAWSGQGAAEGTAAPAESPLAIEPVLDDVTGATPRYLPVIFAEHDRHAGDLGLECKTCHHDIASPGRKPASCTSCHGKSDAKLSLTAAMHESCRGCHLKRAKEIQNSKAPVKCLGCHTERH